MDYSQYEAKARQLKAEMFETSVRARTGHLSSSLSCAELLTALFYGGIMKYNPQNPDWAGRDYLILSKSHVSLLYYTILADVGYFPKEDLSLYAQKGGKMGVLLQASIPGCEALGGSLACGYGIAAGIALSLKMDRELNLVFALLGDGECYEGAVWETAMFAAHNRLNNLVTIVDRNYLSATHFTEEALRLEPMDEKWRAFGFDVKRINGHSFPEIFDALRHVNSRRNTCPLVLIADTVKGNGISFVANQPFWHGMAVTREDQILQAREELGICGADASTIP